RCISTHHGSALRRRPVLLQRSVDRGELVVQVGAESVNDGNDRKRNAGRNQAVFDRGRARFVEPKLLDVLQPCLPSWHLRRIPLGDRTSTGSPLRLSEPLNRNCFVSDTPIPVFSLCHAGPITLRLRFSSKTRALSPDFLLVKTLR